MKNAKLIIENIINTLPVKYRKNAREILETRYLAMHNARETAEITGIPYTIVTETLKAVKLATKGKTLADFVY